MTDMLLGLAGEAQRWQRTLLEARYEIAEMVDLAADRQPDRQDWCNVVIGADSVEATLLELLRLARSACVWLRSQDASPAQGSGVSLLTVAAGCPGLQVRVLLEAGADPSHLTELADWPQAADVRVTNRRSLATQLRHDTILIDGAVLVVLPPRKDMEPESLVVAQPVVADVVQSLFDSIWNMATPLGNAAHIQTVLGCDMKREIVRRLAAGDKDETIARGLNISLRTCRRYVAEIFVATGAVSRFQAGFRIAMDAMSRPECGA
jgi:hypothetical protein